MELHDHKHMKVVMQWVVETDNQIPEVSEVVQVGDQAT